MFSLAIPLQLLSLSPSPVVPAWLLYLTFSELFKLSRSLCLLWENATNSKKTVMKYYLVKLAFSIQIYGSGTLRWAFSLESLGSSFDGFSKIAIIYGIPANDWQILFRSFGKFSKHGLHIYASHKKCKAVYHRCSSK